MSCGCWSYWLLTLCMTGWQSGCLADEMLVSDGVVLFADAIMYYILLLTIAPMLLVMMRMMTTVVLVAAQFLSFQRDRTNKNKQNQKYVSVMATQMYTHS